ncbi:MAG TPA: hypothetical protein VFZ66_09815 [Herpetosiphonaceae bacterium]
MDEHLAAILEALDGVKLLPRRPAETNVVYGYVLPEQLAAIVARVADALNRRGYEVHRCMWAGEAVLLALNGTAHPLALRITSSSAERYNLYALSRPQHAQALWQWAEAMARSHARQRHEPER